MVVQNQPATNTSSPTPKEPPTTGTAVVALEPGGARLSSMRRGGRTEIMEPPDGDAAILRVSSGEAVKATVEEAITLSVVDAIEERHVVDEIRDDDFHGENEALRDNAEEPAAVVDLTTGNNTREDEAAVEKEEEEKQPVPETTLMSALMFALFDNNKKNAVEGKEETTTRTDPDQTTEPVKGIDVQDEPRADPPSHDESHPLPASEILFPAPELLSEELTRDDDISDNKQLIPEDDVVETTLVDYEEKLKAQADEATKTDNKSVVEEPDHQQKENGGDCNCLCFETGDAKEEDEKTAENDILVDEAPLTQTPVIKSEPEYTAPFQTEASSQKVQSAPESTPEKIPLTTEEEPRADESEEMAIVENAVQSGFLACFGCGDLSSTATDESSTTKVSEVQLIPLESNMPSTKREEEEAPQQEKLLDPDPPSIVSAKDDVKGAVEPIQVEDLGPPSKPNTNSAMFVESEVQQMKLTAEPPAVETVKVTDDAGKSDKTNKADKKEKQSDPVIETRRKMLVKELRSAITTFGRYDVRCANISAAIGDLMVEAGEYDRAVKLHKDAVTIYSCKYGDDHATTLDAKVRLGAVLETGGDIEEAINYFYQVTVMRRAVHGDQHPSVADVLVHMAHSLRKNGDYLPAIKELKRALKIYRESLGDDHDRVSQTVDEIASLYVTVGDFDKAAAILEEVVKLKAATVGTKSKGVATTLGQLATAYECSEKYPNAMKALKKAYKIYTEAGGYSCEDATLTLNRMGHLYEVTKDFHRASVAYLGVLRGRKIQYGGDHLAVGETYYRLGRTLRETKQFDKGLNCLKEALPIYIGQGVEMNDIKMVAEIMHEMALINQDKGRYHDAARIFKQELSVRRKVGGPEYPSVARVMKHIGIVDYKLKNYNRSLKNLIDALTIFQERGDQSVECGELLYHTGLVFQKVDNKERALDALTEAVRIFSDNDADSNHELLEEAQKLVDELQKNQTQQKGPKPEGKLPHESLRAKATRRLRKRESPAAGK